MEHIFGPVPSRRLGRSLGVDLVPYKTCTYDCIYCQVGKTTEKTLERREWFPLDDILAELREKLSLTPDYITLSGSGEPTLYSRMGELIHEVRRMTDIPIAVLTNGSLLWLRQVRDELRQANLVIPSLDAGNPIAYMTVNRPHCGLSFEALVEGLVKLREEYSGEYWLEVLLLAGITDSHSQVEEIAQHVRRIRPDRVQLNTVTRPPLEEAAHPVSLTDLTELADLFTPRGEVIADFRGIHHEKCFTTSREAVLQMLERRPCSVEDIANGLGIHRNEVVKHLEELLAQCLIERKQVDDVTFYGVAK